MGDEGPRRPECASALIGARDNAWLPDSFVVRHLADLDLLMTEGFNRLTREFAPGMLDPIEAGFDYWIGTLRGEGKPAPRSLFPVGRVTVTTFGTGRSSP